MVSNLLDDAYNYATTATIGLAHCENRVTLEVSDNGPGISPGKLEEVFEPFYRMKESRNRRPGLRPRVVHSIVLLHGGEVSARNGDNRGLNVEVILSTHMPNC